MNIVVLRKWGIALIAAIALLISGTVSVLTASSASAVAPTVQNLPATAIGDTIATLNCRVNPGGEATDVWATYKPSSALWGSTSVVTTPRQTISGSTTIDVAFSLGGLTPNTSYDYRCKADNASSTTVVDTNTVTFVTCCGTPTTTTTTTTTTPPPTTSTTTVAGAGDICGQGSCAGTANRITALNPDRVFTLGDNAYPDGTLANYTSNYDPYWGAFKAKTLPAIGNHEIKTGSDAGYCSYWGTVAACPSHNRVTDLGKWRLIALDGNSPASTDVTFLTNALQAANTAGDNTMIYWHQPRWSSPCSSCHGSVTNVDGYWKAIVSNGGDVVLNGHDHHYERFAAMNATGGASSTGVREFVVGTGGASLDPNSTTPLAASQVRISQEGVIELTLSTSSYSWRFVSSGGTVLDSGTQATR